MFVIAYIYVCKYIYPHLYRHVNTHVYAYLRMFVESIFVSTRLCAYITVIKYVSKRMTLSSWLGIITFIAIGVHISAVILTKYVV